MNRDGTDVRVMISGLTYPRGLTTICFPNNEPKTSVTPGLVSSATTTLSDNKHPFVNQSDVTIDTGMLNTTFLYF